MTRYVLTGAPGTGKTTLLQLLADHYPTVGEPARELIDEHRSATGENTLEDRAEFFVGLLVERSIAKYQSVSEDVVAIYDRGLADCVAYAGASGVDTRRPLAAARNFRYGNPVFIASPWEEIYTTDRDRSATFAQVEDFHVHLMAVYERLGYTTIELPRTTPAERVAFVVEHLG